MPKKKKTRKQKALSDVRRQKEPTVTFTTLAEHKTQPREHSVASSTPTAVPTTHHTVKHAILTTDYHYLGGDLRKTLFLTIAIIVIQLAIKFGTGI